MMEEVDSEDTESLENYRDERDTVKKMNLKETKNYLFLACKI